MEAFYQVPLPLLIGETDPLGDLLMVVKVSILKGETLQSLQVLREVMLGIRKIVHKALSGFISVDPVPFGLNKMLVMGILLVDLLQPGIKLLEAIAVLLLHFLVTEAVPLANIFDLLINALL